MSNRSTGRVRPVPPADHAEDFSRRYADQLDQYCGVRMAVLGIPEDKIGASDPEFGIRWAAFMPHDRQGGNITTGVTVNSGVLNPDLLKGKKGGRIWSKASLKDRIDAIIAHEWAEDRHGTHEAALKAAARSELPITSGARRILRAMSH
jgi:hypothetical protein